MRDTGPMRAAVFGSWSHQASLVKLGAEAEGPHPCWRRAAAERAAADCVAAGPSAARVHAALRCASPLRGAQQPAACSLACASFEYLLRRSGCEIAWLGLGLGLGLGLRRSGCEIAWRRHAGGRVEGGPGRRHAGGRVEGGWREGQLGVAARSARRLWGTSAVCVAGFCCARVHVRVCSSPGATA